MPKKVLCFATNDKKRPTFDVRHNKTPLADRIYLTLFWNGTIHVFDQSC
jgi:hypothetical protein